MDRGRHDPRGSTAHATAPAGRPATTGASHRVRRLTASPWAGIALVWCAVAATLGFEHRLVAQSLAERAELLAGLAATHVDWTLARVDTQLQRARERLEASGGADPVAVARVAIDAEPLLDRAEVLPPGALPTIHPRVPDRTPATGRGSAGWTPVPAGDGPPTRLRRSDAVTLRTAAGPGAATLVAEVRLDALAALQPTPPGDDWRLSLVVPGDDAPPRTGSRRRLARAALAVEVVAAPGASSAAWWSAARPVVVAGLLLTMLIGVHAARSAHQRRERDRARDESRQARDRADRHQAELRTLVDALPEWMFRTDAAGRVVFVNRHWQTLSGRDDDEAIGRPLTALFHPEDTARVAALAADPAPEGALPRTEVVRLVTADGGERMLSLVLAPMGPHGCGGRAGFAIDVTERERVRRQLAEQHRLTGQLVDAMPLPLFLTDVRGELLLANRRWVEWLRVDALTSGEAGGDADLSPVHAVIQHGLGEVLRDGPRSWPFDLPGPDGALRETVLTKVPLQGDGPDGGAPTGVVGTLVDVTDFRRAERATERARRAAEAASAARDAFVANVSHELRTPLQAILGFAELGRDRSEPGTRPQAMFVRIHESGQRMLRLVEDLLDVSRLASPVARIETRHLPPAAVVADVVEELRTLAGARGIAIELRHPPETATRTASIDPSRYAQVVRNVLANAIRFSPPGQAVEVTLQDADGIALVTVRDHGPGIPDGELDEIFQPFVQSSRTRDGAGGTGLGLAICRGIMAALGGFVTADNHPRGGAAFRIGLRWSDTPAAAAAPTAATPERVA